MSREAAGVRIQAPAKINLTLHVAGRRPDGFHELDTLFQAVDLSDTLEVRLGGEGVRLVVEGADLGPAEDNLVFRAAQAFIGAVALDVGVEILLRKVIPAGAGLGGGSSDAAATLQALEHLIGHPLGSTRLAELGAELGSDVPFFLGTSPLARGSGRGELLDPLAPLESRTLVLVTPPVHVATGPAYGWLADARTGMPSRPPVPAVDTAGWPGIFAAAHNDFQSVVAGRVPEVALALADLTEEGCGPVMLSGSGGACFGFVPVDADGPAVAERIGSRLGWPVRAVRTLTELPRPEGLHPSRG